MDCPLTVRKRCVKQPASRKAVPDCAREKRLELDEPSAFKGTSNFKCPIWLAFAMLAVMVGVTQAAATEALRGKCAVLAPPLDERTRHPWAGAEAHAIGRGV